MRLAFTCWAVKVPSHTGVLDNQEPQLASGMSPSDSQYGVTSAEGFAQAGTSDQQQSFPIERGQYPAFYQLLANALLHGGPPPVDAHQALNVLQLIESLHRQTRVRIAWLAVFLTEGINDV